VGAAAFLVQFEEKRLRFFREVELFSLPFPLTSTRESVNRSLIFSKSSLCPFLKNQTMRSALSRLAAARLGATEAEAPWRWAAAASAAATKISASSPPPSIADSTGHRRALSSSSLASASSPSPSPRDRDDRSSSRPVSPSQFMHDIFARAAASPQRILLNEPGDPRVLRAAAALAERGLCLPVLLGSRPAIRSLAAELAATLLQREKQEGKGAGDGGRTPSGGGGRKKGSGPWSTPSPCPTGAADIDDVEALPADRRFLRGLSKCEIIDPFRDEEVGELTRKYADGLARARAHRGMTLARARELLLPGGEGEAAAGGRVPGASIHFATMMLRSGDAGGLLSGAAHTTLETVRPALQLLTRRRRGEEGDEGGAKGGGRASETATTGVAPPGLVSSLFFMCLPRGVVAFADCALNVSPTPSELARIALDSASTAKAFGLSPPRVALLSYSTRGSGRGAGPDAAAAAAEAARRVAPEGVFVDGPLQYDASVSPSVGERKRKEEKKLSWRVCESEG
jgi:phosphotransacetylase